MREVLLGSFVQPAGLVGFPARSLFVFIRTAHLLWGCCITLGEQGPLSIMPEGASVRNKSQGQVQRQGGRNPQDWNSRKWGPQGAFM